MSVGTRRLDNGPARNLVFALMKLGDWLKAEQAVCDVLGVAPDDEKALYELRRSRHLSGAEADAAIAKVAPYTPRHRPSPGWNRLSKRSGRSTRSGGSR